MLSCVRLFATSGTVAHQPPLSMEFSRQEYWSWLPFPTPGDLPGPMIEPLFPVSPALAGEFFTTELPGKPNTEGVVDNYGKICKDSSWREIDLVFNMFQELWHLN